MINTTNGKKISKVMGNFDFVRVQSIMENLDWKWTGSFRPNSNEAIPEVWELVDKAYDLLIMVMSDVEFAAGGGFEATYYNGELTLKFVVEEASEESLDDFVYTPNEDEDEEDIPF